MPLPQFFSWNRIQEMKKKKIKLLAIILAILALSLSYLFFIPYVEYREPELPSLFSSRLTHPQSSFSFLVGREGGILSKIRKPSLVVYSPLSKVEEKEMKTLQWGRLDSEATYSVFFNPIDMYRFLLESNSDKVIGFLFEENDDEAKKVYDTLSLEFPNLVPVTYYDRVSVVNKDKIVESLNGLWGVIVYGVEDSREAWCNAECKVIMDPLSAASAVSLERVLAITPDWKDIIKSALKGDDISFDYTLTVLEN